MTSTQPPISSDSRRWIYPLIIVFATVAAFGYLAKCEFCSLDDPFNIYANPRLNPPTLRSIAYYWQNAEYGLYIPLTYTIWGLLALVARVDPDEQGVSLNPWVFHSASIAIHMCSALLVYAILNRLIRNQRAACIGAMLFALHPIQVEAVAWAAGLKDVLAGMLALVAIWQYILYAQSQRPDARWYYIAAIISYLLAMLGKPSALVAPIIIFAIDYWLIKRPLQRIVTAIAPWGGLMILFAIIASISQDTTGVEGAPLHLRPLVAGDALAFYLYKLVWPLNLTIDYGRRPMFVRDHWWLYANWAIPVLLGLVLWRGRKSYPQLFIAGLIFVTGVLPVLGFVTFLYQHFSTTADHYLYLSMFGAALAAAWAIAKYERMSVVLAACLILALLDLRTSFQLRVWTDDFRLFSHALTVNPNSFMSANNLGHGYNMHKQPELAEALFRKAISLNPNYPEAHENLAYSLEAKGDLKGAIEHRQAGIRLRLLRPREVQGDLASFILAVTADLIDLGQLADARRYLELADKLRPNNPDTQEMFELLRKKEVAPATQPTTAVSAPTN